MTSPPPEALREAGKALWTEVLGELGEGWALDARELHLLQRACRCADELEDLERAVDQDGVVVRGSRGQASAHPVSLKPVSCAWCSFAFSEASNCLMRTTSLGALRRLGLSALRVAAGIAASGGHGSSSGVARRRPANEETDAGAAQNPHWRYAWLRRSNADERRAGA